MLFNPLISQLFFLLFQLWDVRDGMCRQTFSGHESDINAIGVNWIDFQLDRLEFKSIHLIRCAVLPERLCFRHWIGWCHMSPVWHPGWSRIGYVLSRQHHLRHYIGSVLQIRSLALGWVRWLQLQRLGLDEDRASRLVSLIYRTVWTELLNAIGRCRCASRSRQPCELLGRDGRWYGGGYRILG